MISSRSMVHLLFGFSRWSDEAKFLPPPNTVSGSSATCRNAAHQIVQAIH